MRCRHRRREIVRETFERGHDIKAAFGDRCLRRSEDRPVWKRVVDRGQPRHVGAGGHDPSVYDEIPVFVLDERQFLDHEFRAAVDEGEGHHADLLPEILVSSDRRGEMLEIGGLDERALSASL